MLVLISVSVSFKARPGQVVHASARARAVFLVGVRDKFAQACMRTRLFLCVRAARPCGVYLRGEPYVPHHSYPAVDDRPHCVAPIPPAFELHCIHACLLDEPTQLFVHLSMYPMARSFVNSL
jgi:hypothetical protein